MAGIDVDTMSDAVPQRGPRTVGGSNVISLGPIQAAPLARVLEEEREEAEKFQQQPIVGSLAQYVRKAWTSARDAKRDTVENRMLQSVRARRGEYDPEKLAQIKEMGGSDVYAMLTSVKCRAAASWLRDVLLANGTEKPWTIDATPIPELRPVLNDMIVKRLTKEIYEAEVAGSPFSDEEAVKAFGDLRDMAMNQIREHARKQAGRMEDKMEDQLIEGGFIHALNQFIDDIVTYPAAVIKGPVIRNKPRMQWQMDQFGNYNVVVEKDTKLEWERVSPFNIYPSAESESVNDGYLIEKHSLSRQDLNDLIGVEGYDDGSIRLVLDQYGRSGLRDWLYDDVGQAEAEGKSTAHAITNPDHLIDALQYWGTASGQLLLEWGLTEKEIPDPTQEYSVEVWLIGNVVIKATLNHHPLGEKPYYKACYEEIPGSFWGNSPADLIRDAQTVVNAASRALVNNMGLASGPQVVVNVDRLADGEDVTQLRPWRIWQMTSDGITTGNTRPPVEFSQPQSNVNELAAIIKTFMDLADEWSGIPKYLTGESPGGAGRTASGLSMLINNAGKSLKQVVSNVDNYVLRPLLTRLHYFNMVYGDDPDLKGDVNIIVRGANTLVAKESAAVRRNEFLQMTANPMDMQIVGLEGRAQVLREVAKNLDMDVDRIVPPAEMMKHKAAALAAQQALEQQAQMEQGGNVQVGSGQQLMDGSEVTDNFSPPPKG
jgi:hypothetical protein